jgi:hypothetical protein
VPLAEVVAQGEQRQAGREQGEGNETELAFG